MKNDICEILVNDVFIGDHGYVAGIVNNQLYASIPNMTDDINVYQLPLSFSASSESTQSLSSLDTRTCRINESFIQNYSEKQLLASGDFIALDTRTGSNVIALWQHHDNSTVYELTEQLHLP